MLSDTPGMYEVTGWLAGRGFPVGETPAHGIVVKTTPRMQAGSEGFWAVAGKYGATVMVCQEWLRDVRGIVDTLSITELFSPFGAYELAKVILPRGFGVWGPSWYFLGNGGSFSPCSGRQARRLTDTEQKRVDRRIFWHATPHSGSVGFGIFDNGRLVALAQAYPRTDALWEVGLDVHPEATRSGLGSQVFSAAGRFIRQQGATILARSAPWNVPSVRLLRRLGLKYAVQDLTLMPEPIRVPPQTLGRPVEGARLRQYYPDWAMNADIEPR